MHKQLKVLLETLLYNIPIEYIQNTMNAPFKLFLSSCLSASLLSFWHIKCDKIKRNESNVANIDVELLIQVVTSLLCFTLFLEL
jgi:hypothetical protein